MFVNIEPHSHCFKPLLIHNTYFSTLSQYIATKTLPTHENKGTESCSHDLSSCTRSRRDTHDQYIAKNNEFLARIKTRNTVASLSFSLSLSPSLLLIPRGISIRH